MPNNNAAVSPDRARAGLTAALDITTVLTLSGLSPSESLAALLGVVSIYVQTDYKLAPIARWLTVELLEAIAAIEIEHAADLTGGHA